MVILDIAASQVHIRANYPTEASNYYITNWTIPMLEIHSDLRHLTLKMLHQQHLLHRTITKYDAVVNELINKSTPAGVQEFMDLKMQLRGLTLPEDDLNHYLTAIDTVTTTDLSTNDETFNKAFGFNDIGSLVDFERTLGQLRTTAGAIRWLILPTLDQFIPHANAECIAIPLQVLDNDNITITNQDNITTPVTPEQRQFVKDNLTLGQQLSLLPGLPDPVRTKILSSIPNSVTYVQISETNPNLLASGEFATQSPTIQLPIINALSHGRGVFVPTDDDFAYRQSYYKDQLEKVVLTMTSMTSNSK